MRGGVTMAIAAPLPALAHLPSPASGAAAVSAQGLGGELGWTWGSNWKGLSWKQGLENDAQFVERCLSGDDTAWEDLVRLHTRRVYAVCYRFTGNDSEAQ